MLLQGFLSSLSIFILHHWIALCFLQIQLIHSTNTPNKGHHNPENTLFQYYVYLTNIIYTQQRPPIPYTQQISSYRIPLQTRDSTWLTSLPGWKPIYFTTTQPWRSEPLKFLDTTYSMSVFHTKGIGEFRVSKKSRKFSLPKIQRFVSPVNVYIYIIGSNIIGKTNGIFAIHCKIFQIGPYWILGSKGPSKLHSARRVVKIH